MSSDASPQDNRWHLDKKVPITLIVLFVTNIACSIWIARGMVADAEDTKRRVVALEAARTSEHVSERLAVVETQVADTRAATLRIEAYVQRLLERREK